MLFSGQANPSLPPASPASSRSKLGPVELRTFSNGEVYCRYQESIRGSDVFIVQPTCGNPELNLPPTTR
jgi:ribose-phosphate pyrophosphokinase